uniref:Nephronectin n=1 Tax=Leptobrachium leishanense TaxID=445787 RepID=A0A8C5LLE9_9ANUR
MAMELVFRLMIACSLTLRAAGDFNGRWPMQVASSVGLCRYGSRIDCCWGWTRQTVNQCQHLNECGLKPRPCKYRCMNTYGSYKCYCLNGYMLMPDGSCSNALTCSMANCQYGCDVVKGEVRCRCPSPGLQLGPDGRTCVDVDECATGKTLCPRFRKCVNTFGSYICKCHTGYDLIHSAGKYQCFDIDECYTGQYQCSNYARCYNTPGSYRCKCNEGYRGNGADCSPIPRVMIDPSGPHNFLPGKDNTRNTIRGTGSTLSGSEGGSNRIPDFGGKDPKRPAPPVFVTPKPTTRPQPKPTTKPAPVPTTKPVPKYTRPPPQPVTRPPIPITRPPPPITRPAPKPTTVSTTVRTTTTTTTTTKPTVKTTLGPVIQTTLPTAVTEDNRIFVEPEKPRGDVFIPRHGQQNNIFDIFEVERGLSADEYEGNDDPDTLIHSCNFDHGLCGWIRDKENDLHWEIVKDDKAGQYVTVLEPKGKAGKAARLVLPLGHLSDPGDLCLSFKHIVSGENAGKLQVFVRKVGSHGPAVWGRNGGHGWRETHISIPGKSIKSIIFKGEKGKEKTGHIGLDDVSLKRGHCPKAH